VANSQNNLGDTKRSGNLPVIGAPILRFSRLIRRFGIGVAPELASGLASGLPNFSVEQSPFLIDWDRHVTMSAIAFVSVQLGRFKQPTATITVHVDVAVN
jgi:hypothetical protein